MELLLAGRQGEGRLQHLQRRVTVLPQPVGDLRVLVVLEAAEYEGEAPGGTLAGGHGLWGAPPLPPPRLLVSNYGSLGRGERGRGGSERGARQCDWSLKIRAQHHKKPGKWQECNP